ncbi:hypothetical protein GOA63_31565 [Sinorhizobium meliloti]|uniref:DUF6716 putative glycosyltransferase n=1 Tax=Rhizobium meliloti TaxID=382 RepID=UPI000FD9139C|nr:DUF6716 putative glycosyltransferase [Sinorhizobium meliloti]MDW9596673.1 hypothetical protein [Sinorhizobium meliloti]MDX0191734.1 hypothetical protein [Sinorhizobium meliloti]RVH46113.1 hypothetical protein CN213_34085 [Sinorhizobium meliloti]RVK22159.1 hypothetical protein CN156_32020 [Sinorhizobium meliloti]RVK86756.1 hypothetical protein CN150_34020 [Sinorhizobium meliloti]
MSDSRKLDDDFQRHPLVPSKALLIYSADSYVGYCDVLYEHLTRISCEINVIEVVDDLRAPGLSKAQREKWGVSFPECSIRIVEETELPKRIAESGADFLFLGLPGRKVFQICNTLHEFPSSNALMTIATGFPGLQYYMRFTGLFWRSFVDQLLFTDPNLYRLARNWLSLLPLSTANCVLLGSPRLKEVPTRSHINVRKYIVFFEQNEIPVSSHGRFELARQLTILADLHPDKKLLIVARNSSGETSNHQALDNMRLAHILQEREGRTVEVYNGNWMTIADDIEFAVSVSSTALLEASILQIPSFSIPIGEESKSPFNASRFFQRVGFERQLGDLVGPLPLKPVARAADFLAPLDMNALPQVISRRPKPRRTTKPYELVLRRWCVASARVLDRAFRFIDR